MAETLGVIHPGDIKGAVARVLQTIPGVGNVETKTGGLFEWCRQNKHVPHWEVTVGTNALRGAGIGTIAFESPLIRINGYLPHSYSAPDSTALWDRLTQEVLNALLTYPTLGNLTDGWKSVGLPQVVLADVASVQDGDKSVYAHRLGVDLRGERVFGYGYAATL